ncbi:hypothetical protein J6590_047516 [Homalodisca vitripennis]|nr:hypothetical protein J6590_047516 [Homalodisca vitripennis]
MDKAITSVCHVARARWKRGDVQSPVITGNHDRITRRVVKGGQGHGRMLLYQLFVASAQLITVRLLCQLIELYALNGDKFCRLVLESLLKCLLIYSDTIKEVSRSTSTEGAAEARADGRRHSSHFDNKNSLGMPDADKIRRRQGKQTVKCKISSILETYSFSIVRSESQFSIWPWAFILVSLLIAAYYGRSSGSVVSKKNITTGCFQVLKDDFFLFAMMRSCSRLNVNEVDCQNRLEFLVDVKFKVQLLVRQKDVGVHRTPVK